MTTPSPLADSRKLFFSCQVSLSPMTLWDGCSQGNLTLHLTKAVQLPQHGGSE